MEKKGVNQIGKPCAVVPDFSLFHYKYILFILIRHEITEVKLNAF